MSTANDQVEPPNVPTTDPNVVPDTSKWRALFNSKWFWKQMDDPRIYLNFTEISFYPFYLVVGFAFLAQYFWNKYVYPVLDFRHPFAMKVTMYTSLAYAVGNLIVARWKNPGYLPWNWAVTKKRKFTVQELRDGKASQDDQDNWAKSHESPERAWYTKAQGYFVLRGDHNCSWVGNFIGLYNHKYFLLGVLGFCVFVDCWLHNFIYLMYYRKFKMPIYLFLPFLGVGLFFVFLANNQFLAQCRLLTYNITLCEHLKQRDFQYYHDDNWEGWEDVFGPKKYILLWLIPIPLPAKVDGFEFKKGQYKARGAPEEEQPFL